MRIARAVLTLAMGILLTQGLRPAAAEQGAAPAWAAESPQATGAWVALGLDGAYTRQDGLQISAATTTITLLDLQHGTSVTTAVNDDPALLNRKFDLHWRSGPGAGAQVPIALPRLPLAGLAIHPTLVLQGAWSGWRLGFVDKPEPADSTVVTGQGAVLGLGLDLSAQLCSGCPWFAGAGFRVHTMPSVTADRSPGIAATGFAVPESQTRFRLRGGEALLRIGRSLAGGRIAPYLGILRRRDLLTVDDTLALRSEEVAQETLLHTRTGMVASGTAGIAGVGVRLSGPLLLRLETGFGDRLFTVSLKLSHLGLPVRPRRTQNAPEREVPQAPERSQEEVAGQIIPALERAREELRRTATELGIGLPAQPGAGYEPQKVYHLLDQMEQRLTAALAGPELAAMRDYVRDLFAKARAEIAALPVVAAGPPSAAHLVWAVFRGAPPAPVSPAPAAREERLHAATAGPPPGRLEKGAVDRVLQRIWDKIAIIQFEAKQLDLQLDLCVKSVPKGAVFSMSPVSYELWDGEIQTNRVKPQVWRGLYRYKAKPPKAHLKTATDRGKYWLNLVEGSPRAVECHIYEASDPRDAFCEAQPGGTEQDCPP
ncbi:MAG TPA: hypothetical protein VMW75_05675 [Thermoanaerobaculia bacterium]|nr:hypothetical protein [Thermoanaerobaculia bacterium]